MALSTPFMLLPRNFAPELTAESGQSVLRLCVSLLGAAYMAAVAYLTGAWPGLAAVLAYVFFAYAWIWVAHLRLGSQNGRVLSALTLDQCLIAACLHFGGAPTIVFAWGMPFANIGHGLRFGPRYARIGAAIGTLAGIVAFASSAYWRARPYTSLGLILANYILPVYVTKLADKLWQQKSASEERAKELEIVARTDFLTSELNRSGFSFELDQLVGAGPSREPLAVMLLDLDGFKSINDTAGHAAGDEVLRQVAKSVRGQVRKSDVLARVGGDEFGVIACGVDDSRRAEELGAAIQAAIADIRIPGYPLLRVGASIGYCLVARDTPAQPDAIMAAADDMMYATKRGATRIRAIG